MTCDTAAGPTPLLAVQMYSPPLWRSILSMLRLVDTSFISPELKNIFVLTKSEKHYIKHIKLKAKNEENNCPTERFWKCTIFYLYNSRITCYIIIQVVILPFGNTLFLRVHVTFGLGLPDAKHSMRTALPFFACTLAPELMWCILGGTIKNGKEKA